MGNTVLTCMGGDAMVEVVLLTGGIAQFRGTVTASMVMNRYPDHLVLQCFVYRDGRYGHRQEVKLVRPEQILNVSQIYLILPIQLVGVSRAYLRSWASHSLRSSLARVHPERNPRKLARRSIPMKNMFVKVFWSQCLVIPLTDDESKPLLGGGEQSYAPPLKKTKSSRCNRNGRKGWKPSLDVIDELPMF